MTFTAVLPYIHWPYARDCMHTMHLDFMRHTLKVDNTERNVGIMRSHNMGIAKMREDGTDWLVVVSAAIRFGRPGGMDFIAELDKHAGHDVVEASGVFGWHLIAFSRRIIDDVGAWDENFSPYGFDDLDYSLRIQRARNVDGRWGQLWTKVYVACTDMGMAHSISLGGVRTLPEKQIDYFREKWGRHPGDSHLDAYDRPFNNPDAGLDDWPRHTAQAIIDTIPRPAA